MERTLRELHEAMQAYREALTGGARPVAAVPDSATAPAADGQDARARVVEALARDIETISGIEISGIMEAKLARVLSSVPLAGLSAWVSRLHLLPPDDGEWLSLIESLTVHETFFHRDSAQLDLLRTRLLPELIARLAAGGRRTLRLWSAGCATGEEAYTLAILALTALREAGFASDPTLGRERVPPWQVDILGTDISRLVLTRAETATYQARELGAFRHLPSGLDRFFPVLPPDAAEPGGELRGVDPVVRRRVRFRHFNLMSAAPPETGFDIVLCRNVLIYFTEAAKQKAVSTLRQGLHPDGYLLLGPTDTPGSGFAPHWSDGAVAYRLIPDDA